MPNDLQKPSLYTEDSPAGEEQLAEQQRDQLPAQQPCQQLNRQPDQQPALSLEQPSARMLLHACCGPCTLEPSRVLRSEGYDVTVYYANSNIEPAEEYAHRLETLEQWAADDGLPVIEGPYDNAAWRARVADCAFDERSERCRACYRVRFEESARFAAEHGFDVLGTTLSVSPYQHTEIIREELERAAAQAGIEAHFEDYRPLYDEATHRSRELGMYRQNYCGCALSAAEAKRERAERKAERAAQRAAAAEAHAEERAAAKAAADQARAEKQVYAAKQARKKQILRQLREESR